MKDTTIIDGVTITRQQAVRALEDMNQPDPFKHFDLVRSWSGQFGVVIRGYAQLMYAKGSGQVCDFLIIGDGNSLVWSFSDNDPYPYTTWKRVRHLESK
jgi:hypothetical protein